MQFANIFFSDISNGFLDILQKMEKSTKNVLKFQCSVIQDIFTFV